MLSISRTPLARLKKTLGWYKRRYHYRLLTMFTVSLGMWLFLSNRTITDAFACITVGIVFEVMTMNLLFKRDFYPLNSIVDPLFERQSLAHKLSYTVFYLVFWGTGFYILHQKWFGS